MKTPFGKIPGKKKRKTKSKAKPKKPGLPKPRPEPWKPPHPTKPKTPVIEGDDERLVKPVNAPVTYQISSGSEVTEATAHPFLPPEQRQPEQKPFYPREQSARKNFLKTFRLLTGRWRSWDIWTDFVTLSAITISNSVDKVHFDEREKVYLRIVNKYTPSERAAFPELFAHMVMALEENPEQDFLGDIYTELGLNSKEHKQIFTPYHVCHFMAEITMDDIVSQVEEQGFIEIHDCCCGAGATLIAAANVVKDKLNKFGINYQHHVLITGQDIDRVATMMCYIQLSLLGIAGYFKVGNALTDSMTVNDNLDNYWFTPMYFFPVWHYRRLYRAMDKIIGGAVDGQV